MKSKIISIFVMLLILGCVNHKPFIYNFDGKYFHWFEYANLVFSQSFHSNLERTGTLLKIRIENHNDFKVGVELKLLLHSEHGFKETNLQSVMIPPRSDGLIRLDLVGLYHLKSFRITYIQSFKYVLTQPKESG